MNNKELLLNILNFLKPYKLRLYFAAISLITVVTCMLLLGYAIRHFIDHGFGVHSNEASMIYIITLTIIFGISSFFRSYLINSTAEFAANDVKKAAYRTLLRLDTKQIDAYSFSDLATRINADSDYITRVIIDSTSFFLRNILTTIGGITLMFLNSPKLSSVAFIVIAIISIFASSLSKKVRYLAKKAENAKALASSLVFETIANHKVINSYSNQPLIENYFEKLNDDAKQKIVERLKFRSLFFASTISCMIITIAAIVWFGSQEVISGNISSGTLASFLFYSFMTATSFGGIMEMINDQQKNLANCERVFDILKLSEESFAKGESLIKFPLSGNINLKNINYNYSTQENIAKIISNLNITIPIGKFTVITGHSGIGKTTLLHLIIGLYQFHHGVLEIGGISHENITPQMWSNRLSYVPQDNMLFSGTIAENISFFNPDISENEIMNLLEGLELNSYIAALPSGIHSELGNMGTKISGGQKQRIAIARALITKPEILILDEATSQLDEETEDKVLDFIKLKMKDKTVICVAHRRGAIAKADTLINL